MRTRAVLRRASPTPAPLLSPQGVRPAAPGAAREPSPPLRQTPRTDPPRGHEFGAIAVQRKLAVGAPGDRYEREADRAARGAVRGPGAGPAVLSPLRRYLASGSRSAPSGVEASLRRARGRGRPLDPEVRRAMEGALGADFGSVAVHTGVEADRLGGVLGARAFAAGRDLFFRRGEYRPSSPGGRELIAHELAHVVQQTGAAGNSAAAGVQCYYYRDAEGNVAWREGEPGGDVEVTGEEHETVEHGRARIHTDRRQAKRKADDNSSGEPQGPTLVPEDPVGEGASKRVKADRGMEVEEGPPQRSIGEQLLRIPPERTQGMMDSVLAGFDERIFSHLPYSDLANTMQVSRQFRSLATALTAPRTVQGLDPGLYHGMLRSVGRTSETGTIASSQDRPTGHNVLSEDWPADPGSTADVVRALGWREHTAPHREPGEGSRTLNEFAAKVREHSAVTAKLRRGKLDEMYPKKSGDFGTQNDKKEPPSKDVAPLKALGSHWVRTLGGPFGEERKHHPLDLEALNLVSDHRLTGNGQNVSVTQDRVPGEPRVFTNNPLSAETSGKITAKGYEPTFTSSEDRKSWGRAQGIGRKLYSDWPIPFHSEMQRLEYAEPWQLGYSGNNYLACPQCAMGYHAMGTEGFRGTHGRKSPSVIPPRIRENSVYLSKYLGRETYDAVKDHPAAEIGGFLDRVERGDAGFYDRYGIEGAADIRKDLWGKIKPPKK